MRRYHIYSIVPAVTDSIKYNFNIPVEYKKIIGVLATCSGALLETKMDMKIDGTEFIPKNFDLKLINFNGNVERDKVLLPINIVNNNALMEVNLTAEAAILGSTIKLYFEVEY